MRVTCGTDIIEVSRIKNAMENEKASELLKSIWENLTDEQKEKAKECKTADELIAFAGEEGIELPDEVLDAVAGGAALPYYPIEDYVGATTTCKRCGKPFSYQFYYTMTLNGHREGGEGFDKPDFCPECENPAEYVGR